MNISHTLPDCVRPSPSAELAASRSLSLFVCLINYRSGVRCARVKPTAVSHHHRHAALLQILGSCLNSPPELRLTFPASATYLLCCLCWLYDTCSLNWLLIQSRLPQHTLSCSVLDLHPPTRFPFLDLQRALIWMQLETSAPSLAVSQPSKLINKTIHLFWSRLCALLLDCPPALTDDLPIYSSAALKHVNMFNMKLEPGDASSA